MRSDRPLWADLVLLRVQRNRRARSQINGNYGLLADRRSAAPALYPMARKADVLGPGLSDDGVAQWYHFRRRQCRRRVGPGDRRLYSVY